MSSCFPRWLVLGSLALSACGDADHASMQGRSELASASAPDGAHDASLPTADDACTKRSVESCAAASECLAVWGTPLDVEKACVHARTFAGCMRADSGCDAAAFVSRADDGTYWRFGSSCIPAGFEGAESAETIDIRNFVRCTEP